MGFMTRVAAAPAARAAVGVASTGLLAGFGAVPSASGASISQATAMTVSTVYACANRLATDLARCSPYLWRWAEDNSKLRIKEHPLLRLFIRPNRQQTWFEFDRMMWTGYLLRGNAYAAIRRDGRGNPVELIPINPDGVLVMEAVDGSIFYNVARIGLWQMAMLRHFPLSIPSEDVFHLRDVTFNGLVGVSNIGLARDAIGLDIALSQQANRWIKNGARPSVWLKTGKQLSEIGAKRLKTQFDDIHAGYENAGKTVLLEEGVEPHALQLTSVDLEFIAQRRLQPEEICRYFGMPPHKVGVAAEGKGASQNLAAQDQDYVNSAITQRVVNFEQRFAWTFGLDDDELFVERDLSQLLRADVMTRANVSRLNILSGKTTQNEERAADGLAPKPGGDRLMMPVNMAAEGSNITGQAPDGAGRPAGGTLGDGSAGTGGTQATGQETASG